jgi:hypothetical protein
MEKVFEMEKNCFHNIYFVVPTEKYNCYFKSHMDEGIAEAIGIPLKEYIEILETYRATYLAGEYSFRFAQDCKNCIDYLNETYGILVVLNG